MLTVKTLNEFGADTSDGLKRCMGLEDFYLDLVRSVIDDTQLSMLEKALNEGERDRAFEYAHALKGVYANLSLNPLYEPLAEMTEILRAGSGADCSGLMQQAKDAFSRLKALADS